MTFLLLMLIRHGEVMEGTCTSIRWLSGESCLPQRAASACRRPASVLPFDSQERAGRDYDPSTRLGKLFHKSKRKQISPHCLAAVLTVWLQSSLSGCSPHCLTAVLTVWLQSSLSDCSPHCLRAPNQSDKKSEFFSPSKFAFSSDNRVVWWHVVDEFIHILIDNGAENVPSYTS